VYNKPSFLFAVAIFSACIQGSVMPVFAGVVLSKVLSLTSVPFHIIHLMYPE